MCHIDGMIDIYCNELEFFPVLRRVLKAAGYEGQYDLRAPTDYDGRTDILWIGDTLNFSLPSRQIFPAQFRMGALLDQMMVMLARQEDTAFYEWGPFYLDIRHLKLEITDADFQKHEIILTDTEIRLMRVLMQAAGKALSREYLMDVVWSYAPDLETHTVETHIYRLRQKMDLAGGFSALLQTSEDGYFLDVKK